VTPAVAADLDAFHLLAKLIEAILLPFMDMKASLSDQVKSLLKYAHLAFALFQAHQDSLMSNQLYGDTQTMIKNIMFCIAKQMAQANFIFFRLELID